MGSYVEPTTVTAGLAPLSPPHDSHDLISVGSAELEEIEGLSPLSDEDPDHAHGQDRGQKLNHESSSANAVLTDDLKIKIIKQVEYYFSDENLQTDKYMMSLIKKNKEGFVFISMIASFRRMKRLTRSNPPILAALKESSMLVVSSDGKKVKRRNPLPPIEVRDPKLHALVEYQTAEAAEKAVTTFNDERDWRSGMHVKLLKRMGNYAQRRQAWRGPEPEKNSNTRASDQTGDDEKHTSSQHHEGLPDDEGGEPLSKEKMGIDLKTKGEQGNPKLVAMERHPHSMPPNHQSHLLALECPTELGGSQWDVDAHSSLNRPSSELCPCSCPGIIFALWVGYCDCETVQTWKAGRGFPHKYGFKGFETPYMGYLMMLLVYISFANLASIMRNTTS